MSRSASNVLDAVTDYVGKIQ